MECHRKYWFFEIQPLLYELNTDDMCLYSILLKISKFHKYCHYGRKVQRTAQLLAPRNGRTMNKACPLSSSNLKARTSFL